MNNYYLKINAVIKNNKRYFRTCDLYKGNKLIKTYDRDATKQIHKLAKEHYIDIVNKKNGYIIDNIDFIDKYIGIPSKKVSRINPYIGMIATFTSLSLAALGISALDHKYNPQLYDTSITNDVDDEDLIDNSMVCYDTGSDEETKDDTELYNMDEANVSLVYNTVDEDNNKPHVIIYSDNDDNFKESTNESLILNSTDNISSYFNDEQKYEFNYSDLENLSFTDNLKTSYGDSIKKYADFYGIDYNLIVAIIAQENPFNDISNYAAGQMQVERSVWHDKTFIDKDGSELYIDCNRMDYDSEYAIHVGCYIYWFTYNKLNDDNNANMFNYKLTDSEVLALSIESYNKSIYSVEPVLQRTNNVDEAFAEINTLAGDEDYHLKVLSGLNENTVLTMKPINGEVKQILVNNQSLENTVVK